MLISQVTKWFLDICCWIDGSPWGEPSIFIYDQKNAAKIVKMEAITMATEPTIAKYF